MNQYQKFSALFLRLVGSIMAIIGLMGPVVIGLMLAFGKDTPAYGYERWTGSVLWSVAGVLLVIYAKPLGRLLGRGLT